MSHRWVIAASASDDGYHATCRDCDETTIFPLYPKMDFVFIPPKRAVTDASTSYLNTLIDTGLYDQRGEERGS